MRHPKIEDTLAQRLESATDPAAVDVPAFIIVTKGDAAAVEEVRRTPGVQVRNVIVGSIVLASISIEGAERLVQQGAVEALNGNGERRISGD